MFLLTHDQRHGAHYQVCDLMRVVGSYVAIFGPVSEILSMNE